MKTQIINSMVIDAMAKICENKCKDVDDCTESCSEQQYLFEMLWKYPVTEISISEEEIEEFAKILNDNVDKELGLDEYDYYDSSTQSKIKEIE